MGIDGYALANYSEVVLRKKDSDAAILFSFPALLLTIQMVLETFRSLHLKLFIQIVIFNFFHVWKIWQCFDEFLYPGFIQIPE